MNRIWNPLSRLGLVLSLAVVLFAGCSDEAPSNTTGIARSADTQGGGEPIAATFSNPSCKADVFSDFDTPPQPIQMIPAAYPKSARLAGQQGMVGLLVTISETGHVCNAVVNLTSAVQVLDQAALDAVGQWKFDPATKEGVAMACRISIPFRFSL